MSIRMLIVSYCIWPFTSLSRLCGLTLLFNVLPGRGIGHLNPLPLKEKGGKVCLNKWIKYKCRTIDSMHQPETGYPHWWLEILISHLISRMLPSKGNWKMVSMRRQPVWVRIIFWKTKDCPPNYLLLPAGKSTIHQQKTEVHCCRLLAAGQVAVLPYWHHWEVGVDTLVQWHICIYSSGGWDDVYHPRTHHLSNYNITVLYFFLRPYLRPCHCFFGGNEVSFAG